MSSHLPQPLFKPHFPFIFISHFILPVSEPPFSSQVCSPSSPTMAKNRGAHSYRPRVRQSPTPTAGASTPRGTITAGPSAAAMSSPAAGASPATSAATAAVAGPSAPVVGPSVAAAASPAPTAVEGTVVADVEGSSSMALAQR